ncbi:aminotransferase class I/II-fold pyridoxal phosphate-dependent enzyme [Nafulsella turpanensis]|uniref:aminotransferase class I/II-fold pyridoxal phosphate-dependent enzyme n=1 Tax=Nafulsella turpanensis TaxID=1265690 RepID=UPI00036ECB67|nr:8-amino-7-oxononanoate synthase [Nafulsella turpanensis]
MKLIEEHIQKKLESRRQDGTLRRLHPESRKIDFSSNDYLGLARNKDLSRQISQAFEELALMNGSTGSRLICGHSALAEELEAFMASFFKAGSTLLMNSGYMANMALLSALPQKNDTILYDELVHASIKEGCRLSMAQRFSFKHNEVPSLKNRLKRASGQVFVVVESVYSMDGDIAPLAELAELCDSQGAALVVDEAHSTGIFGEGKGLVCALGLEEKVWARVYTFGKAMGSHGACVAGTADLKEYLINFARPFIYTTALPPHSLVALQESFRFLSNHQELIEELGRRIEWFQVLKKEKLLPLLDSSCQIESYSPVQAIVIPDVNKLREVALQVQKQDFDVRPIVSPTVPQGKERLRICLHAYNTETEINGLVESLAAALV